MRLSWYALILLQFGLSVCSHIYLFDTLVFNTVFSFLNNCIQEKNGVELDDLRCFNNSRGSILQTLKGASTCKLILLFFGYDDDAQVENKAAAAFHGVTFSTHKGILKKAESFGEEPFKFLQDILGKGAIHH